MTDMYLLGVRTAGRISEFGPFLDIRQTDPILGTHWSLEHFWSLKHFSSTMYIFVPRFDGCKYIKITANSSFKV